MKPTLLVLAAGMGSRYGGLKQLDPVGPSGEVILDYSVFDAHRAGFGKIVFVIRRDIEEAFKAQVGSKYENHIQVEYAYQELSDLPEGFEVPEGRVKPWGTIHAMLSAREIVKEPFGVINADDFYGPGSFRLLAAALQARENSQGDYVLVAYPLKNTVSEHGTVSRGVCEVAAGKLAGVEECHEIHPVADGIEVNRGGELEVMDGSQLVSMNTWGFTPELFAHAQAGFKDFLGTLPDPMKSEYYIPTLVQQLIDRQQASVEVLHSDDHWLGVTYPEDKPAVQAGLKALLAEGVYSDPLWS
ncbi:sugar phosphate nucleotidyltransferase [Kiritimatiellaeota bacterium B1221]|nr:sugar phosphate nucleotidyltransferase [Kiritimatiellaeota bacterium B1221]